MLNYTWLIPALPLLGFLVLVLFRLPRTIAAVVGVGSIALAALLTFGVVIELLALPEGGQLFQQHLWTWIATDSFEANFAFYIDPLASYFSSISGPGSPLTRLRRISLFISILWQP